MVNDVRRKAVTLERYPVDQPFVPLGLQPESGELLALA